MSSREQSAAGNSPAGKSPPKKSPPEKSPPEKSPAGKTRAATSAAAREHARQLREAQRRRAQRRRLLLTVGAPVLVVVLIVVAFVIVKARQPATSGSAAGSAAGAASGSTAGSASGSTAGSAAAGPPAATTLAAGVKVPASAFDAVGTGTGVYPPAAVSGPALAADNKPRVLYIGAEYCPFCAGERWAVAAALSRFGTFSNLGTTRSSGTDIYPDTASLSFHGATYRSPLLSFTGVELTTNVPEPGSAGGYTALDTLSPADRQLDATYNPKGSIPLVDIGNRYTIVGASYDVSVLQGLSQTQIAAQLADPSTKVAKQVLGAANMITAALCTLTGKQPAAVCTSPAVTSQHLPA